MLSVLKRADRERVDMARDLYDEVQMALNEQAREDEERRREEREQREREDERKRLKDEKRREKREAQLIQTLSAAQMIGILDAFPALPPSLPSVSQASSAAPRTLQSFLCEHYALQHLMFTNAPQPSSLSAASGLLTVDWSSPPAFRHVLSRRFTAAEFPSYLHPELDSLDPSAASLLGFLRSWLQSYHADRAAFTSLLSFLTLKLAELQSLTAQLASPNALVTYISVDAILLLLSSSSLCSSQRGQVVLSLLLDIVLLAVYAKHSETGSGHVRVEDATWAVRVRVLEGELLARKEEHRAVQRRMQSMHEQWLRVLHMWQPCVARAIRKWQLPIEALAFQYWACSHRRTCWRRAEPLPLPVPAQPRACDSMSRMLSTMRLRWARRHDARVVFLEWRQQSILSRLGLLRDELRRLDGINADKASELSSLAATASRYRASIDGSEREVEDGQLRIRMMLVQHDEYSEQLQAYGVQEEETGRLVCLFSALMLRAVEECELALVQLFYQRGQDISRLGELDSLDDADAAAGAGAGEEAAQAAGGAAAGESRDEKRRKTRLVLAGLLSKKKASSSRKARKAQEQDSKAFLRVWLRFHYSQLAHLFPAASAQQRMPADTDVLVAASPALHARHRSMIAPVPPSLFSLATDLSAASNSLPSRPSTGRRRSSVLRAGGAVDVAAAFLNALRQQSHSVFPLPPFSHDAAFLHHHSHPPLLYEDESGDDEELRRQREADRRKEREEEAVDADSGLPLELTRLLSLAHPADAQSLPSLFSFMPELILPATPSSAADAGSSLAYSLPFVLPASLRAPHFLLQSIALLPQFLAPATSASSSTAKLDAELLHDASALYLLHSFPATPFDLDDELCHLQELIALTRDFAQAGRSAFLRLHSEVMRVVLVNVRQWRRRVKRRREEMRVSEALWWRHLRRGEEELTRRLMRRIREKEAVMKAANIAYERLPANAADSPTASAGREVDRVESAFGEVELEAQVELDISKPGGQTDDAKDKGKRKRGKGGKAEARKQQPSAAAGAGSAAVESEAEDERLHSAGSALSGSGEVSVEFEQEKAEDEAESSQLHYDSDRLRDVLAQAADRLRVKQAEDKEKREKKAKKGVKAKEQPGEPAKEPAAAADSGGADGEDRKEDGREAAAAEDEDDDLLAEDESVQCEETMLQYIIDLRRLFRNACETDETSGAAEAAASPASVSAVSAASRDPSSSSAGQWLLSKVHFGRLIRKYKILSKSCSAQFIDGLWEEKQTSKRGGSALSTAAADGSDSGTAAALTAADDGVITFDDFLELLVRIAVTKYAAEATLLSRVSALLTRDLFPALKGPSPLADFRTVLALTCEPVFDKHNKFLSQIFRAYSSDRESSGGVQEPAMTRRDFDEFIEHTQLLSRKTIAVRTVAVLWGSAQMDEEGEGGDGGALFGGSSSMVYWEFLEAIAAMSCYYERDPFLPVDSRLEQFVQFLQDGCALVETKRRMYAAKMQGDKGSGGVGGAGAATSNTAAAAGASK